ncbi:MAG: hypothetical protein F6J95_024635 [Leptolyngbya sp. SIO1E4]|nr:hypothetical protein [Leptolyngbya sp. SIO1E4]
MGRFNTQRYLPLMNWQAGKAQQHLRETGQITVVIQDGASLLGIKKTDAATKTHR